MSEKDESFYSAVAGSFVDLSNQILPRNYGQNLDYRFRIFHNDFWQHENRKYFHWFVFHYFDEDSLVSYDHR